MLVKKKKNKWCESVNFILNREILYCGGQMSHNAIIYLYILDIALDIALCDILWL